MCDGCQSYINKSHQEMVLLIKSFKNNIAKVKKLHCPNVCTIHNNSKIIIEKNAILCEQAHSKIQNFCLFHCSCASGLFCTSLFKDGGHACSCTTQIGHLLRSGSDSPQPGRGGLGQESNTGPDCFQAICTFTLFISDHLSWISVFLFFKCTVFASKISLTFFLMFLADYYCSVFFFFFSNLPFNKNDSREMTGKGMEEREDDACQGPHVESEPSSP